MVVVGTLLTLSTIEIVRHTKTGWLFPRGPLFQGWMFVGVNVLIYCWTCWIAFWCTRNTVAKERLFMLGYFVPVLLWRLRVLLPHWANAIRYVGAFWLGVAFVAAFSLLPDLPERADESHANPDL